MAERTTPRAALPLTPGLERWSSAVALVAIAAIYALLPQRLRVGPWWLMLAFVGVLLVPLLITHRRGLTVATHWIGRLLTALVTLSVVASATFLLTRLPGGKTPGEDLLRDAALVWGANILAFALWYWEVDGGGPGHRHHGHYTSHDFVFPQMQQDPAQGSAYWVPGFIDYLFLAFNTSTAFSPTDTLVLSRRVKLLMMAQSLISLVVIGFLVARAINTL